MEENLKSFFVLGAVVLSTSVKRRRGLTSNRSITGPILLCTPSFPVSPGGHEYQRKTPNGSICTPMEMVI